jgi:hypothetical protein
MEHVNHPHNTGVIEGEDGLVDSPTPGNQEGDNHS